MNKIEILDIKDKLEVARGEIFQLKHTIDMLLEHFELEIYSPISAIRKKGVKNA